MIENSNPTTKKCPMCAEEIPLASVSCEYCDAQFEVNSTGYCQDCHAVREADENGQCKVCGNAVLDFHVESKFVEAPIQEPVSPPTPISQPEIRKARMKLPTGILVGFLVLAAMGVSLWIGRNNLSAILAPTITPTITHTLIPTLTATSTTTPTRTPRPTPVGTNTFMPTPDRRVVNPTNQHLYLYVKAQLSWHEAKNYCATLGGHLVTIQAPSENKFVYELATDNINYGTWLGGSDEEIEGTWKWVTGEPWNYRSWDTTNVVQPEPDIKDAESDYLNFGGWDKDWHSKRNAELYFVCEWEQ
jgi:hypothetical protein